MVYDEFDAAQAHATEVGWRVCGTLLKDGTPKYFVMKPEATDDEIRAKAFELREGRPMNSYERWGLDVAEKLLAQRAPA